MGERVAAGGREPWLLILTRQLLHLYPSVWRERYTEEMLQVLRQHPVTMWTMLDLLVGAFDARLHSNLLPERVMSMAHRIRNSEIIIFSAFALFGLAWLSVGLVRDPLTIWENTVRLHPEILLAFSIVQAAGGIAFLALLAGGLPILFATLRHAILTRRWKLLLLLLAPPIAWAILAAYGLLTISASTARQSLSPNAPLTPLAFLLQLSLVLFFLAALGGSVAAVAQAVSRSYVDLRLLRLMLWPAAGVTVSIGIAMAATIALTALSYMEAPQLVPGNLLAMAILMALATLLAAFALRRGIIAATHGDASGYSRTSS
jgi:hypothetical protein